MSARFDKAKGQAKQAAGVLTGNKHLESDGKADRRVGDVKAKLDRAKDKVEAGIDKAKGAVHRK